MSKTTEDVYWCDGIFSKKEQKSMVASKCGNFILARDFTQSASFCGGRWTRKDNVFCCSNRCRISLHIPPLPLGDFGIEREVLISALRRRNSKIKQLKRRKLTRTKKLAHERDGFREDLEALKKKFSITQSAEV